MSSSLDYPVIAELLAFTGLALLGLLLMRLIQWDEALKNNQERWLRQLRKNTGRLRQVRKALAKTGGEWPRLPLGRSFQRNVTVARWMLKALAASRGARC